ncbi:MAG TPA: PHP domain-containing protein [Chloroflexota bacterium]|nr:PHP domain-containing protein [Chloroflexota bacterium]
MLDLHLHSIVSDGRLSPGDLVRHAYAHGVRVMALSDHDTTDGVAEAQQVGEALGVRVIPAIELSTDLPGASIHVLGLFLNHENAEFQSVIRGFREARLTRAAEMVEALTRLGAPITLARVFEIAGEGSVGRPHVAQALLEAGHIQSIDEAFDRFIGRGGPAYFEGFRLEPAEGIRLIHSVGGLAAWAHPNELDGKDWRQYLQAVVSAGIDGLEVYYSKEYGPEIAAQMHEACKTYDLVPTVGSDFHGFGTLAALPGSVQSPSDLLQRLEARVARIRTEFQRA